MPGASRHSARAYEMSGCKLQTSQAREHLPEHDTGTAPSIHPRFTATYTYMASMKSCSICERLPLLINAAILEGNGIRM
jgi:hypothetical protein